MNPLILKAREYQEIQKAATQGPWKSYGHEDAGAHVQASMRDTDERRITLFIATCEVAPGYADNVANAAYIATLPDQTALIGKLADEVERLEAALRCERETGTCVAVHDPARENCDLSNCPYIAQAALDRSLK